MSATEAGHRIFANELHNNITHVLSLAYAGQLVYSYEQDELEGVLSTKIKTTLNGWFLTNRT